MKLLFLILAHERPQQVLELCEALVGAASDAVALIHYDSRSSGSDFALLQAGAAGNPRIRLAAKRCAGRWGSFGLVEAPLAALSQAEREGLDPDYVILLSGACLPCRPVRQLERFLQDNAGREFIEVEDESWIGNGWRAERWRYRFWFDHKTNRPAEWAFLQIQRALRLRRRFPAGLTPRFGSQWWALTWDTCRRILAETRANPARLDFFREVWIPDEMAFQTYVHALVSPDRIAGYGLTHFQFSNRGKPVVYHDDHVAYVDTLPRFFFRKADPAAAALRRHSLARASGPDDGRILGRIGTRRGDYALRMTAQTAAPAPGHLYFRNQLPTAPATVLATRDTPYVVLLGAPSMTRELAQALEGAPGMTVLGEAFSPREVDLGPGRARLHGLRREDAEQRDAHPALYLMRLRERGGGCLALTWSPLHAPALLKAVLGDPAALVVACLPFTGDQRRDRGLLALACQDERPSPDVARRVLPEATPGRLLNALLGTAAAAAGTRLDPLPWDHLYGELPARDPGREESVPKPGPVRMSPSRLVMMPWSGGLGEVGPEERLALFEASLQACRFRSQQWFPALRAALASAFPGSLDREATALLGGLGREAAAPAIQPDRFGGAGPGRRRLAQERIS